MAASQPERTSCAQHLTRRSGRSLWLRRRLDRRGWTSTSIAMRWPIGTCPVIRSTWNNVKAEFTVTKGMLFERTWPRIMELQ